MICFVSLFTAVRDDRTRGGRNKFGPLYKRDREMKRRLAMALLSANASTQPSASNASAPMPAGDLKFDATTMFQQQMGLMAGLGLMQGAGAGVQHSPQMQAAGGIHARSMALGAHGDGSLGEAAMGGVGLLEQSMHSDSGSCSSLGGSSAGGGGGGGYGTSGPPFSQQRSQGHHSPARGAQHSSLTQLNSPQHLYPLLLFPFPILCFCSFSLLLRASHYSDCEMQPT